MFFFILYVYFCLNWYYGLKHMRLNIGPNQFIFAELLRKYDNHRNHCINITLKVIELNVNIVSLSKEN